MRNLFHMPALCAFLLTLLSCDGLELSGESSGARQVSDFQLGYISRSSKLKEMTGGASESVFTAFVPKDMYDAMAATGSLPEGAVRRNRYEFTDGKTALELKVTPATGARVEQVTAVSSDTTVARIVSAGASSVVVDFRKLGDTDLTVSVAGGGGTVVKVFPLRVVGSVDLRFRITPFWMRQVATKIRMSTRHMPKGVSDMVMMSTDSVTVVGYCEFYDFEKYGRSPQARRDTLKYPKRRFVCHYKRNAYYLLRDITGAMRDLSDSYVLGSRIVTAQVTDESGKVRTRQDTVPYRYYYVPEQVILDYTAVCDNPYVEFLVSVRSKKESKVLSGNGKGKGWPEEDDDVGGGTLIDGTDEDEDDGEAGEEDERVTQQYFKVLMNDFLTQSQRDAMTREVEDLKKRYNYNDGLSEEQKDRAMEDINRNL